MFVPHLRRVVKKNFFDGGADVFEAEAGGRGGVITSEVGMTKTSAQ